MVGYKMNSSTIGVYTMAKAFSVKNFEHEWILFYFDMDSTFC